MENKLMKKIEIIEELCEYYRYKKDELKGKTKEELLELLNELSNTSNLFPNGRDFDAENLND